MNGSCSSDLMTVEFMRVSITHSNRTTSSHGALMSDYEDGDMNSSKEYRQVEVKMYIQPHPTCPSPPLHFIGAVDEKLLVADPDTEWKQLNSRIWSSVSRQRRKTLFGYLTKSHWIASDSS